MMSTANLLHQLHICLLITVKNGDDVESLILQWIFMIASVSQSEQKCWWCCQEGGGGGGSCSMSALFKLWSQYNEGKKTFPGALFTHAATWNPKSRILLSISVRSSSEFILMCPKDDLWEKQFLFFLFFFSDRGIEKQTVSAGSRKKTNMHACVEDRWRENNAQENCFREKKKDRNHEWFRQTVTGCTSLDA